MNIYNISDIRSAIQIAFLGEIKNNVRAIAFNYTHDTFVLYGYLDNCPTKDDYDIFDYAMTEIFSYFPTLKYQNIELSECKEEYVNIMPSYKGWFYIRYEKHHDGK